MQTARAIRSIPLAPLLRALLLCAIFAQTATAQSQLPRDFASKQQLSATEKQTLVTFLEDRTDQLTSSDPEQAAAATKALNAPFNASSISVAFRLECSNAIAPVLDDLVNDTDSRVAFVAASLAGKIATARTARVLGSALSDTRPAVRYAAAVGYRELLDPVFADEPLAIGANQIPSIFESIEEAIASEDDANVAQGLIAALAAAAGANNTQAADQALTALARATAALASRLRENPPADGAEDWDRAIYRAIKLAYDESLNQQINRDQIDTEFARQSGIASGLALAYVQHRLESADLNDGQATEALVPLAEAAESFLVIVNSQINPGSSLSSGKAKRAATKAIDDDDPQEFQSAIEDFMSLIKRSPYSVPADQLP